MRFRPCIDIHNGKVKQIVGGSLRDENNGCAVRENYVSEKDASWYADLYRNKNLPGGHVILLNPAGSPEYEATLAQAKNALAAWPGGLMVGGGVTPQNAAEFLDAGASHVIVTSYVFRNGRIDRNRLEELVCTVGKKHIVLDLSCRAVFSEPDPAEPADHQEVTEVGKTEYRVTTDRWQKITEEAVTPELLRELQDSCDEFLIHAVDVEGKASGIETEIVRILAEGAGIPATYAGGIHSLEDVRKIGQVGKNRVDFTIGSALDLFGGHLKLEDVLREAAGCGGEEKR